MLNVAFLSGLISEMNHEIIVRELTAIVSLLKEKVFEGAAKAGYILSDSFFKTDPSLLNKYSRTDMQTNAGATGLASMTTMTDVSGAVGKDAIGKTGDRKFKDKGQKEKTVVKVAVKDKKDGRKAAIIALLKKKSHLTIKDFSEAIVGCSIKTIQRELLDLVAKGVVEKEGERRWSRYSLA